MQTTAVYVSGVQSKESWLRERLQELEGCVSRYIWSGLNIPNGLMREVEEVKQEICAIQALKGKMECQLQLTDGSNPQIAYTERRW